MAALRPTQASTLSANLPNPHVWPEQEFRVFIHTPPPASLTFIPWPGVSAEPSSPRWRRAPPPRTASPSASRGLAHSSSSTFAFIARPETAPEPLPPPWSRPQSVHVVAGGMTRVASPHRPDTTPIISRQTARRCYTSPRDPPPGHSYPWPSMQHQTPRLGTKFLRPRAHDRATYVRGGGGGGPRQQHQRYGYTATGFDVCCEPKRRTIQDEKMAWARQRQVIGTSPMHVPNPAQDITFHKKTTPGHWGHRHTEPVPTTMRTIENVGGWPTRESVSRGGARPLLTSSPVRHASARYGPLQGHALTPTSFRDVRSQ